MELHPTYLYSLPKTSEKDYRSLKQIITNILTYFNVLLLYSIVTYMFLNFPPFLLPMLSMKSLES